MKNRTVKKKQNDKNKRILENSKYFTQLSEPEQIASWKGFYLATGIALPVLVAGYFLVLALLPLSGEGTKIMNLIFFGMLGVLFFIGAVGNWFSFKITKSKKVLIEAGTLTLCFVAFLICTMLMFCDVRSLIFVGE